MITIEAAYYFLIPLYLIVNACYYVISRLILKKSAGGNRYLADSILLIYLLGLVAVTLFPLNIAFDASFRRIMPLAAYFQMVPFQTMKGYFLDISFQSMLPFVGNIILLMPLALYINVFYRWSWRKNLCFAFLFSASIEVMQGVINLLAFYPNKVTDVDDLLFNTAGYMLALLAVPIARRIYQSLS